MLTIYLTDYIYNISHLENYKDCIKCLFRSYIKINYNKPNFKIIYSSDSAKLSLNWIFSYDNTEVVCLAIGISAFKRRLVDITEINSWLYEATKSYYEIEI